MQARLLRLGEVYRRSWHFALTIVGLCCCAHSAEAQGQSHLQAVREDLPPAAQQADDPCWASLQPIGRTLGGLSCASSSCHGREPSRSGGNASRQEFVRWLQHDPHAKAAAILSTTEFADILTAVSKRPDGSVDKSVYAKCAACHDPEGLAAHRQQGDRSSLQAGHQHVQGIGCESCHGPAEKWIGVHYQQGVTADELTALGMVDTDNLLTRSRACVACHVGDETHDMNHDMIAAGHPPLRFEVSAYHDLITTKHWSDRERIQTSDFKVQLWLAGQLATADATLGLLESRANRSLQTGGDKLPKAPWPEFAEYDCFACHQRLRPQAEFVGVATTSPNHETGTPSWQPWNALLADRLLSGHSSASDKLAPPSFFHPLQVQMQASFRGSPAAAASQARALRGQLRHHPLCAGFRSTKGRTGQLSAEQMIALVQQPTDDGGWAPAAQELLALKAGYLALRDRAATLDAGTAPTPNLPLASGSGATRGRIETVAKSLSFGSPKFEWPAFESSIPAEEAAAAPCHSLGEIQATIQKIARELQREASSQPQHREDAHE